MCVPSPWFAFSLRPRTQRAPRALLPLGPRAELVVALVAALLELQVRAVAAVLVLRVGGRLERGRALLEPRLEPLVAHAVLVAQRRRRVLEDRVGAVLDLLRVAADQGEVEGLSREAGLHRRR